MKQYAPEELWERLMSTYNMDSYPHMWESFEQCMGIVPGGFRQKWHASWITSIHYMMKKSVIM